MKVRAFNQHSTKADVEVDDRVQCTLDGPAVVEVREYDGKMIVVINSRAKVSLEPRAAGIWIVVEDR